ncbi:juvenile hormone epoxide hydrolase 1-like isoform X1 [Neodiprion fabricii]|uniref:juvenile hormone epoxide hydrolase 1-like isoform X1 n=1 Tax=Neodiprion fabricii TaxID=2872261 RepID=UPI001ED8CC78|nr:juvenile hormone epoxide hydrolase 1-like isoform X1 [Neodiprion fabricii]
MWKLTLVSLLLIYGIAKYIGSTGQPELPVLPSDQYWGPGQAREVDKSIRPFKIDIPKQVIDDLKTRLSRTRSLTKPLEGAAWTYGVNTGYLQTVLEYWREKYNWTERQALLNKYPQFKTNIQGLDIHFYHVKPTVPKDRPVRVLPLLLLHGWPGSVVEFQKAIPLLSTPRPDQDFVFELVVPSLPGYGFSDSAVRPGLGSAQVAVLMTNLMNRLGFEKFYTQGGDWGSLITTNIGILRPTNVLGAHLNLCSSRTVSSTLWSILGSYIPSLIVSDEHWSKMYPLSYHWSRLVEEMGYLHIQSTKPDTVGVALSDSPAGLAAYILEKFSTWTNPEYRFGEDGKLLEKFTIDELLDNLMLYWVTNSITTSMRLYSESFNSAQQSLKLDSANLRVPTGCAIFPHEISYQPESLLRLRYSDLVQVNHMPRGGHFAFFEEPQLLADDVWSFVGLVEKKKKTKQTATSTEL